MKATQDISNPIIDSKPPPPPPPKKKKKKIIAKIRFGMTGVTQKVCRSICNSRHIQTIIILLYLLVEFLCNFFSASVFSVLSFRYSVCKKKQSYDAICKNEKNSTFCVESRKNTYIILTPLLYSKTGVYRGIHYFSSFCSNA